LPTIGSTWAKGLALRIPFDNGSSLLKGLGLEWRAVDFPKGKGRIVQFVQDNEAFNWREWQEALDESPEPYRYAELYRGPIISILDTSCVRTGLHYQLANGQPPASVRTAKNGFIRMFMEQETLIETCEKLPSFAAQFKIEISTLTRMFARDWLPHIRIVSIPSQLRELDPRALAVRNLDADDYPAAALAALLSPCILLTHNHHDFKPLGVRDPSQGVKAVLAAVDIEVGQRNLHALAAIPALPTMTALAGFKWASDRIGPAAWLGAGLLVAGGFVIYRHQPQSRQQAIKNFGHSTGKFLFDEGVKALTLAEQGRQSFEMFVVPSPESRTQTSTILRHIAVTSGSISAQRICESLERSSRPSAAILREFLHANKNDLFFEMRRGSFALGRRYTIEIPSP
jgi:hypothetical protein